ncbi:MAG: hypothetical protein IPK81_15845 [Rhodospirillales bacterium]|nr:MAG: hypothetical protein IPK81_15845 [Rhodospirillales bacterium]
MTRAALLQPSFTAGELSPRLAGRVDLAQYKSGLAVCENMIVLPHGAVTRRPGTRFVALAKDQTAPARLVPFVHSVDQSYVLEIAAGAVRFLSDGVDGPGALRVPALPAGVAAGPLTGWTDASDAGATAVAGAAPSSLDLTAGATARARARRLITGLSGPDRALRVEVAGGPVSIRVGTAAGGAELVAERALDTGWHSVAFAVAAGGSDVWLEIAVPEAGGARHVGSIALLSDVDLELPLPYGSAAARELDHAQSGDVLILTHADHAPRRLARYGHLSWSSTALAVSDGPFTTENLDPANQLYVWNLTGDDVQLTSSKDVFAAADVGRQVRLKQGARWGWARIVTYVGPREVRIAIPAPLHTYGGTAAWRLGAWGGSRGWPRCVAFHQQRLFFAATRAQPQTVWASKAGEYDVFSPTVAIDGASGDHETTDECGLSYTLAADQVNGILWLAPLRDLMIGTAGGEFRLAAGEDRGLTPLNALVRAETVHGSAAPRPVRCGSAVLFVQRAGRKLRELGFDAAADGFRAPDATLLAEHVGAGGIVDLAWQQEPDGLMWACTGAGGLIAMTYDRSQQIVAWHRHPTDGAVESLACVPGARELGADRLWLIVNRPVGATAHRFIEVMERCDIDAPMTALRVDCGLSRHGAPVTTVSGLDHLAGRVVTGVADGVPVPPRAVSGGGAVTLDAPAVDVSLGLPFVSAIETLRPEAGAEDGTAQGKAKRAHKALLRLRASAGGHAGVPGGPLDPLVYRAATPWSGDLAIDLPAGLGHDGRVRIEQRQPLPFTLLALSTRLVVHDGG